MIDTLKNCIISSSNKLHNSSREGHQLWSKNWY